MHARRLTRLAHRGLALGVVALAGCHPRPPDPPDGPDEPAPRVEDEAPRARAPDHAQARELVRNFEAEAAFTAFARLLKADPGDGEAGLGLAQTALEFGLEARAEEQFQHAVDLDSTASLGARLGLARLAFARYEQSGAQATFDSSQKQLRNVLAVDSDNPRALALAVLFHLRRAERRAGDRAPLARAICEEREPVHASLAASCGEEARRRGDPARARELFARALRADPKHHGAWLRWGRLELDVGNLRAARRDFERAADSPWPSLRVEAQAMLGVALDRLGDTRAAIAAYTAARDTCERSDRQPPPELLFNLGLAASELASTEAELDEAQAALERYLELAEPSDARRLQVQRALTELESIRAENERAQR